MGHIDPGTYRGNSEGLTFEFRIECATDAQVCVVSGDISRGPDFISSFICATPQVTEGGRTITGPLTFRGNPELFTGSLYLNTDERGVGSFQVSVDLEGGYRDVFAGRIDWQGSFLRRLAIEIDGLEGTQPPDGYTTRGGAVMTIERAFEQAGFDVSLTVDPFTGRGTNRNRMRGYTLAEIHAAMTQRRSQVPADRLHAHVFVCSYLAGRGNRGVLGVMYDFGQHDLNRSPREGVAVFYDHPMLSDPRVPEQDRRREYVYTLIHEIGHALNLLHSFDKSRPTALSWMNYPHLYPRGYEAGREYDGTAEFWRRFEERFDAEELRHLRHASPREIRAGGFAFGVYEEGGWPFNGGTGPRRTRLGANPLRATRSVEVEVGPVKREYDLGEPVFLRIGVKNIGADAAHVPDSLDPAEGYVRLIIRTPLGRVIRYRPPVRLCKQAQLVHLPPGEAMPSFEGLPLFLSAEGPLFTEPGVYQVMAELTGVDGSKNVYSQSARIRVRPPDDATETFAHKLWDKPAALEAMYLRHPLTAKNDWDEIEEDLKRAELKPDNTTESYLNYIAGLGWMTPFAAPNAREKESNIEKAVERISKVDPRGLPSSVGHRQKGLLERRRKPAVSALSKYGSAVIATRPEERARAEVPPSGLFGSIGLAQERPDESLDPFVRVVPSLRGLRRFADIVSWNIENLYKPANFWKIPKVAELIRGFRCDFWGVQEISRAALAQVKETINSSGQTRYDVVAVEGSGQQSGAIFRTDTTSVSVLDPPEGFFGEEIDVEMSNGDVVRRRVFLRLPLLCDVRVKQGSDKVFDFRCAVVHLKSTDTQIKDRGNGMRLAAARELARWIEADREAGSERDYLILGDMNAETAKQGLEAFAEGENLRLLSVGMQDRYGNAEALTRVASKRLLDHIVVTGESFISIPPEDEEEQIIIRSDHEISDWTGSLSDHVPVAVRFIISEDQD
jgi:endonuclease/exonuclease/phosphatase family metal-dependent hydrolase